MEVPEGWARTDKPRNVMFSDKFNSIQIELVDAPSAPTAASVKAEVPALAAAARCFRAGPVTVVSRKAGPAVFLKYTDEGPADVVTGKRAIRDVERYAFWHNGVAAVITLAGATGSDNVDPWRRVTGSFAWR